MRTHPQSTDTGPPYSSPIGKDPASHRLTQELTESPCLGHDARHATMHA